MTRKEDEKAFRRMLGFTSGPSSSSGLYLVFSREPTEWALVARNSWEGQKHQVVVALTKAELAEHAETLLYGQSYSENGGRLLVSTNQRAWREALNNGGSLLEHAARDIGRRFSGEYDFEQD